MAAAPPWKTRSLIFPSATDFSWSRVGASFRDPIRSGVEWVRSSVSPQRGPTVKFNSVEEAEEVEEKGKPETEAESLEQQARPVLKTMPQTVLSAQDRSEKLDELEERAENIEEGCRVLEVRGKGLLEKSRAENRKMTMYASIAGVIVVVLIIIVVVVVVTRK